MSELYLGDPLMDFQYGCQMDYRFKMAYDFLKSGVVPVEALAPPLRAIDGTVVDPGPETKARLTPAGRASYALDLAEAFFEQGKVRGWIKDMPDTDEVSPRQQRHIRRLVRVQLFQNQAAQTVSAEDGQRVQPIHGRMPS